LQLFPASSSFSFFLYEFISCTYYFEAVLSIVYILQKIVVCSNSAMLQHYNTDIRQSVVLNSISRNNNDLFKFLFAIATI
jgi:hypothetical protein